MGNEGSELGRCPIFFLSREKVRKNKILLKPFKTTTSKWRPNEGLLLRILPPSNPFKASRNL